MKKVMISVVAVVCIILFVSAAFAEEKEEAWWFKPALSVGYAFDASSREYTFTTHDFGLGGVRKMNVKAPRLSGIYIGGELPFAITDRLKVALEGNWTLSLAKGRMDEVYNNVMGFRSWDVDNNMNAVTVDILASYAFVKDFLFIKDVSVAAGFRWDYHTMSFDEPISSGILSLPADTLDLSTHTLAPVFGLTGTFKGFKSGMFGGDMSLGVLAGPIVWGRLNYKEVYGVTVATFRSNDNFSKGYFLKVFGEITALSGKIMSGMDGSLSIFAQYTRSQAEGTVDIDWSTTIGVIRSSRFGFDTDSDVVVVGLKGAIKF